MPTNLDLDAPDPLTPPVLTANQNDWGPNGGNRAATWYVSASEPVDVTGIAGGTANRSLRLVNIGAETITLVSTSEDSAAANRFLSAIDIALAAGETLQLVYVDGASVGWATTDAGAMVEAAGVTNLSVTDTSSTTLKIASSTGTDATVPVATTSLGGLMSAADKTALDTVAALTVLTVATKSADYTTTDSDFGTYFRFTAGTPTLHAPAGGHVGKTITIRNATGASVTVAAGAATVNGSRIVPDGRNLVLLCTAANNFDAIGGA